MDSKMFGRRINSPSGFLPMVGARGFCPLIFGEAPSAASERYNALACGMKTAIAEISPGMTGSEVFNLTMAAVHEAGFTEYRRHHVGHGGLEPYERPILAPTETECIEAGMILSVETPFYEFGFGALHIEDPIVIGSETNRLLTHHSIQP